MTCNNLSITIEELSEAIGYETKILNDTINDNITITKSISKAVELYRKNIELEEKLKESENIKSILKKWLL
ncbi:MAG: hypothetical protein ACNI28_02310 [Arcobacter sp.]|uniref:hypothetical protein n=1 Tax=Arcobacter sp. TaxID=1872629 RepID=UPI003B00698A